ncbi:Hsp70 family protein [Dactylosporangium cerinum]|uniref:Hsp70 family protein n=1 Tax=Dactylosporangium cerinum TaxID=1434730 RepID=A0ABV9WHI5_9ACTN
MTAGAPPNDPALVYGIDLGGWNCTVAIARVDGPTVEQLATRVVPAAVGVTEDGRRLAGRPAQEALQHDPARYRRGLMEAFGQREAVWLSDAPVAVDELMALLLGELRTAALAALPDAPDRVAIAVPSGWADARRQALLAAAAAAGFDPSSTVLVDRAVAAATPATAGLAGDKQRHLLVYDLGASTFTASLLRRTTTGRLLQLGQEAIRTDLGAGAGDQELLTALADRSPQVAELLDRPDPDADERHRIAGLHALAETVKHRLSTHDHADTYVTLVRPGFTFEAERGAFEETIRLVVAATVDTCTDLLDRHDLSWSAVDVVVLCGGGANLPLVTRGLAGRGRGVDAPAQPELTVARGAAVHAARQIQAVLDRRRAALEVDARAIPTTGRLPNPRPAPGMFMAAVTAWLVWAASGGWFTYTHWHGGWAWATLGVGALMLVLIAAGFVAMSDTAVGTSVAACTVVGAVHLVTLVVCAWRALFTDAPVGWVPFVGTAVGLAAVFCFGTAAILVIDEIPDHRSVHTWTAEQRRLGRSVIEDRASGVKPVPDLASRLLAGHVAARAFRPADGPFDVAVVQGRTLLLGSTEPESRPTADAIEAAIGSYLGMPESVPALEREIRPRFVERQINVHCFLVGELSAAAETYAQEVTKTLQAATMATRKDGWPTITVTLAVVAGGDLTTRMARLLERADREYYLPLLERAAEAAGLRS